VCEDGVLVDPVLLVGVELAGVEFARGNDEVALLTVDVVAIDGELARETVEVLELLALCERRLDHVGVENTDVRQRRAVVVDRHRIGRLLSPVALVLDVLTVDEAVRAFGRVHVALNVFEFFLRGIRLDRKLLHCQRPPDTHDERGEQHQHGRERRNAQIPHESTGEERDGTDDGDDEENQLGRQHRVDVGVAGAGEDLLLALAGQQRVPVEPVRHGLEQQECPPRTGC